MSRSRESCDAMKVDINDIEDHRRQARVEVEWEKVQSDYDDLLSEYAKLPIPGFRPGKAPKAMVEKHFERPLLDDVGARCVRRVSRQALDGEGIISTGPISITEILIEHGEPFRFTAEFTELPRFELPLYDSLDLSSDSDDGLRDEISIRLLEETAIDIPGEMVRQEMSFDGDDESRRGDKEWDAALSRVKLLLILGEIARRDGIEVDDRDVDERIEQIAQAHGTDASSLEKHLLRNGGLSRISGFILAEKTLDYLIDINRGKE